MADAHRQPLKASRKAFDINNRPREGRPKTFEDDKLETWLNEDTCHTQEELASATSYFKATICAGNNSETRNLRFL